MKATQVTQGRTSRAFRAAALFFALIVGGLVVGNGYEIEVGCGCKAVTFNPPSFMFD